MELKSGGDFRPLEVSGRSARVAILSLRGIARRVWCANGYDFEDSIAANLDEARILSPLPGNQMSEYALQVMNWAARRNLPSTSLGLGSLATSFVEDADLFFFNPAFVSDLKFLAALPQWRDRSRFAVCWLQECWIKDLESVKNYAKILNRFDHVICPFYLSTPALEKILDVPVSYLPWGVDTALFRPLPKPPHRAIDILTIGKIDPATHDDLVSYAESSGKFYQYNTAMVGDFTSTHVAHRRNYAGTLKRSKYFMTYLAKVATTAHRGAQEEFGLRYVEGAASGAVLLGDSVSNPAFEDWFGWPDAVISSPYGSRDLPALIEELEANPSRVATIRRRNIVEALQRHDHLYRWEQILKIAGMPSLPKLDARRTLLAELTARATSAAEEEFLT